MARRKTHEEFVAEVNGTTDGEYEVLGIYVKNDIKIPIRHNVCGKITEMVPRNFTSGRRCGKCAGRHRNTQSFKEQIHKVTNGEYEVLGEYVNNRTHLKVKHLICGTAYNVMPTNILRGRRCPTCKKAKISKAKRKPITQFKQEFREILGEEYVLLSTYKTAKDYVKVLHKKCGNEYEVVPDSILRGSGCPNCAISKGEKKIAEFLDALGIKYLREHRVKYDEKKYPLRFDFFINGVAVEYDGEQHFKPVEHFGGAQYFKETQTRDRIKDKYCVDNKIPLIRVSYKDFDCIDAILTEKLLPLLEKRAI